MRDLIFSEKKFGIHKQTIEWDVRCTYWFLFLVPVPSIISIHALKSNDLTIVGEITDMLNVFAIAKKLKSIWISAMLPSIYGLCVCGNTRFGACVSFI